MSAVRVLLRRALTARYSAPVNSSFALKIPPGLRFYGNSPAVSSSQNDLPQTPSQNRRDPLYDSVFGPADESQLADIGRNLKPSYTFAAYVNDSETLQELVKLGVDLSKIEKKRELAEYVLQLNFDRDVKPYVQFLHDHGVAPDDLGDVLSRNIAICQVPLEDLQVRINYLESKRFNKDMIAGIIIRNPLWLSTPVSAIDGRLGWLQTTFKLTGDEVRLVINTLPKIATYDINAIKLNMFVFEEEMEMPKYMMKNLLKTRPRLFTTSQRKLLSSFEFVSKVMKVSVDNIWHQPDILMERTFKIKERHYFLESIGRAQYNPLLPGYVSLDAFIKTTDVEFCTDVAKSTVLAFNLFLKTL